MLQIKNICKRYKTGDLYQDALKDVSLNFRDNEFVSILGPSGSGKTTLLNIIGGLDKYDDGDLVINNISTKEYSDRDWDSYRNHTIGFVFQSYNLIPHQTILSNVEIALTISGISKRERRERALTALDEVGLKEHAHKKPNQLSGGQMQRVAIARALVNNPDILLADEPTGALDSETSVMVMELLKKVANDRLVIMVTHNPELAETYSTRIIKLKDGVIIDDSNPLSIEGKSLLEPQYENFGKSFMSLRTALSLSFNNLLTKKSRTILTAFAGSIGIIGIALILSLSTGFKAYIDKVQEDTLTSYPLTITSETADMTSALLSMVSETLDEPDGEKVKEQQYISTMFTEIGKNDLKSLKKHFEKNSDKLNDITTLVRYNYSVSPMIYTVNCNNKITQLNPSPMMSYFSQNAEAMTSTMAVDTSVFFEMINDEKIINEQYKVLKGKLPESYDEVVIILPSENSISDMLLYSIGLRDMEKLQSMMMDISAGKKIKNKEEALVFTYDDLMETELKLINPSQLYKYNEKYDVYEDMTLDEEHIKSVYKNGTELKVVGVLCPKDGSSIVSMGVGYTKDLTEHIITESSKSNIVKQQLKNNEIDIFSGKRFDDNSSKVELDFEEMITIDTEKLSSAFNINVDEKEIDKIIEEYMLDVSNDITADTTKAKKDFIDALTNLSKNMFLSYIDKNGVNGIATINKEKTATFVDEYMKTDSVSSVLNKLENDYIIPKDIYQTTYKELLKAMLDSYQMLGYPLTEEAVEPFITQFILQKEVLNISNQFAQNMTETVVRKNVLEKIGKLSSELIALIANNLNVDEEIIASAFKFELDEEELMRLMQTISANSEQKTASSNLLKLGYQDLESPSSIAIYFDNFDSKEKVVEFLNNYNESVKASNKEKVIKWTDLTGILISSVKTIVDSVTYVLIAFVSISLVVSSIMIGIITYISVLERTKEIGILRAMGASKRNISSIFNAETFIVGLLSGLIGVGISFAATFPINNIIHLLTNNYDINAVLPLEGAIILIVLSVVLTLIGGLIPSKKASKKDPVIALRTE